MLCQQSQWQFKLSYADNKEGQQLQYALTTG
jgi:hypothetical protein